MIFICDELGKVLTREDHALRRLYQTCLRQVFDRFYLNTHVEDIEAVHFNLVASLEWIETSGIRRARRRLSVLISVHTAINAHILREDRLLCHDVAFRLEHTLNFRCSLYYARLGRKTELMHAVSSMFICSSTVSFISICPTKGTSTAITRREISRARRWPILTESSLP